MVNIRLFKEGAELTSWQQYRPSAPASTWFKTVKTVAQSLQDYCRLEVIDGFPLADLHANQQCLTNNGLQ